MRKLKSIVGILLALLLCMPFINITNAKAASTARVSISSASGEVGDTVSVTVTVNASGGVGGATIYVSYDSSVVAPTSSGNAGTATVTFMDEDTSETQSKTLTFKIVGPGTSKLNVVGNSRVVGMDMQQLTVSSSSGSITGNAPASYSTDNTLSSLEISPGVLSPAFSPNVTAYTSSVSSDCASLVVSAVANDSKASVRVTGTRMDMGLNTTTITVTAENGSTRTYTIKTTKGDSVTKEDVTNSTTQDNNNKTDNNNGDTPQDSPVQEPTLNVSSKEYKIISSFEEHPLPEGYVQSETDYNGIKITVGMGTNTRVVLAYLESVDGTGESGFYVYDSVNNTFSKFIEVYQPQLSYCVLPIDEASMELPEGYDLGKISINGKEVDAMLDSSGNYALFYGVSSTGESGWFRYNINDGTIQGYAGYNIVDEPVFTNLLDASAQVSDKKSFSQISRLAMIIIGVLCVIVVGLIVYIFVLSNKLTKSKKVFASAMNNYSNSGEYEELAKREYASSDDDTEEDNDEYEEEQYSQNSYDSDLSNNEENADFEENVSEDAEETFKSGYQNTDQYKAQEQSEELELEEIDDKDKN